MSRRKAVDQVDHLVDLYLGLTDTQRTTFHYAQKVIALQQGIAVTAATAPRIGRPPGSKTRSTKPAELALSGTGATGTAASANTAGYSGTTAGEDKL